MILYHGTNIDFNEIRLDKSRVGKDFGVGFYLTPDKQVAARQAARKFRQYGEGEEMVLRFNRDVILKVSLPKRNSWKRLSIIR